MTESVTYEVIGKITVELFKAEKERIKARIKRAEERSDHKCQHTDREYEEDDTGANAYYCYHRQGYGGRSGFLPFEEWCDNCKHCQPFHLAYMEAAQKARIARYKMNRRIKKMVEQQPH